jgi:hypothetical protein
MKKIFLSFITIAILGSCKKENVNTTPETSDQKLVKITKTSTYGGGVISIAYAYNDAGKLIQEGDQVYYRDEQQRIVRIRTNTVDIEVHYKDDKSKEVNYTSRRWLNNSTDSIVYLHDHNGKLIKMTCYYNDASGAAGMPALSEYKEFTYDADGNLLQWDDYKFNGGIKSHCGSFSFEYYDKKINPLCTNDEVRIAEITWGGMLNNCTNNCTHAGSSVRVYDYRADGRPRSCVSHGSADNEYKLVFEYK